MRKIFEYTGYIVLLLLIVFWMTFDFRPSGKFLLTGPLLLGALFSFPFTFIYGLATLFSGKIKLSKNLEIDGRASRWISALLCMLGLIIGFGMFGLPILFMRHYINLGLYERLYVSFPQIGILLMIIAVIIVIKNVITIKRARLPSVSQ